MSTKKLQIVNRMITTDETLTQSGVAADAKAVGDLLAEKQPIGDYALKSEIQAAPVQSINAKTGEVVLTASDVGALPDTTVIPSIEGLATEAYVDTTVQETLEATLPTPTEDDAGRILRVNAEGKYALVSLANAEEATF